MDVDFTSSLRHTIASLRENVFDSIENASNSLADSDFFRQHVLFIPPEERNQNNHQQISRSSSTTDTSDNGSSNDLRHHLITTTSASDTTTNIGDSARNNNSNQSSQRGNNISSFDNISSRIANNNDSSMVTDGIAASASASSSVIQGDLLGVSSGRKISSSSQQQMMMTLSDIGERKPSNSAKNEEIASNSEQKDPQMSNIEGYLEPTRYSLGSVAERESVTENSMQPASSSNGNGNGNRNINNNEMESVQTPTPPRSPRATPPVTVDPVVRGADEDENAIGRLSVAIREFRLEPNAASISSKIYFKAFLSGQKVVSQEVSQNKQGRIDNQFIFDCFFEMDILDISADFIVHVYKTRLFTSDELVGQVIIPLSSILPPLINAIDIPTQSFFNYPLAAWFELFPLSKSKKKFRPASADIAKTGMNKPSESLGFIRVDVDMGLNSRMTMF